LTGNINLCFETQNFTWNATAICWYLTELCSGQVGTEALYMCKLHNFLPFTLHCGDSTGDNVLSG